MTRAELMSDAKRLDPERFYAALDGGEDGVLAALEIVYEHGFADEQTGDVDGPIGHVYRVGQWIVETNAQGDHEVGECASVEAAVETFENLAAMISAAG